LEGFRIEKYGLLSGSGNVIEKEIIKEVIKYVEVPVVEEKEVIKIEYVEVIKETPSPPTEIEVVKYIDREVIKEIKVEVPVEKIVYIYDKKEEEVVTNLDNICDKPEPIIIEKIVEVIKEVVVEKEVIVEKDDSKLKPKLDALQNTVQKLKLDNIEKDRLLKEYEKTIQDIQKFNEGTKAMYLKGSNLDNKL
jgi:ADP-ribose pyrophosphatase YjhB (NUDIX family)